MHSNSKRKKKLERKKKDRKLETLQHQLLRKRKEKNNGKYTNFVQQQGVIV